MKTYKMKLDGYEIEYDVVYKKIKSVYIRIKNHRLVISAPVYYKKSMIEEIIEKHKDSILSQLQTYKSYGEYKNGGYVYILGDCYRIVLRDMKKRVCQIHDQSLYVYHKDIEKTIQLFLKQYLHDYIEKRVIYYQDSFKVKYPGIEIKKYKSRWGTCFYKNNKMSFHLGLVHLDKDLVDYVIVHELSHFLVHDHSSRFYKEIEKRMPDYQMRIKRLKEEHT